jgi:hypothetical protein
MRLSRSYYHSGMLPRAVIVKLEFCIGDRLFALSPDR